MIGNSDEYVLFYKSVKPYPEKTIDQVLDFYHGYLTKAAPIFRKRLPEIIDEPALDSIRALNSCIEWSQEEWNIRNLEVTKSDKAKRTKTIISISRILFNEKRNKAVLHMHFNRCNDANAGVYALKKINNKWRGIPMPLSTYYGDGFSYGCEN